MRLLVTGGCGFIGSTFINHMLHGQHAAFVLNVDRLDYGPASAANVDRFGPDRYVLAAADICDQPGLAALARRHGITHLAHFAAQSHVDQSFADVPQCVRDNVLGTCAVLETARQLGLQRLLLVSTDEVYGESRPDDAGPKAAASSVLRPTNPYAATKAAAEMLGAAFYCSFGTPVVTTRSNNVYGPRQFPDKLVPRCITRLLAGQPCQVHGAGTSRRTFLFVDDLVCVLRLVLERGQAGRVYDVRGADELSVLDVVREVGRQVGGAEPVLEFVQDRPFNDARYVVDGARVRDELGWEPQTRFADGLQRTIAWFRRPCFLVLGANGWLAQPLAAELDRLGRVVRATDRLGSAAACDRLLDRYPEAAHVVCCIGRTHGPQCDTVDYLEDHPEANDRDNLLVPLALALACAQRGRHLTYLGTGCIFQTAATEPPVPPDAAPTFRGSAYSRAKGVVDELLHLPLLAAAVLNVRVRMPFAGGPRDFHRKVYRYRHSLASAANSVTVVPTLFPLLAADIARGRTGTVNLTNPGYVTHEQVLDCVAAAAGRPIARTLVPVEPRAKARRSNTVLESSYPDAVPALDAVRQFCLANPVKP
jgi:dTDP-glucose 4,6-dehydratase